ncbi:Phage protein [Candidatus Arthromitus sp. SFB-mouse-NL]|uniref:Panacea domain-containing protein n=1 Tax=Candidatus Arthromitus sp. SFB-mouse-NL TaxID=1508644 RepID=UPI000499CD64|nr:type II toxin-antitoxin system antitoxin SocA domain-containing protein [Candidatus Arthromitus sp. SFB-mouse-NL]AID44748.1 Phage protein [Candidatus Arthromitus sp. SFB-mouse-NL]
MYKHVIFLYTSYFCKKKLALHYCYDGINVKKYTDIIDNVKNQFSHLDFNIHVVYTASSNFNSIYDIDSYFEDTEFIDYLDYKKFISYISKDTKISAIDVAKAILCKKDLSNLELQKILYFVAVRFLKKYDIQLFEEEFGCWEFGPVVSSVYHNYKEYGKKRISIDNKFKVIVFSKLSRFDHYYDLLYIIDDVLEEYKNCLPKTLVDISHKSGGAWRESQKLGNNTISWDLMKSCND